VGNVVVITIKQGEMKENAIYRYIIELYDNGRHLGRRISRWNLGKCKKKIFFLSAARQVEIKKKLKRQTTENNERSRRRGLRHIYYNRGPMPPECYKQRRRFHQLSFLSPGSPLVSFSFTGCSSPSVSVSEFNFFLLTRFERPSQKRL
jgi:hypothetical protein